MIWPSALGELSSERLPKGGKLGAFVQCKAGYINGWPLAHLQDSQQDQQMVATAGFMSPWFMCRLYNKS